MLRTAIQAYMVLSTLALYVSAAETNPARVPTASVTEPTNLLKEADGLEFRFSYFPSLDRLRLLVLGAPGKFVKWEAVLSPQDKSEILARCEGKLPFADAGETIRVPALGDGTYEVKLALIASDGTRREIRRTFQRRHFAWENNRLGQDRVVIPPFTPLVAVESPASVTSVLRRHELDGTGLWRQVVSGGRDLLATPMRLEIESGGKTHVAGGVRVALTEKAADRVRGNQLVDSRAVEGTQRVRVRLRRDDEGHLAFRSAGQRVDALQLVIPMKTGEAWLMHPVTDLLRFHYAGRIPNGKGWIWDYGGKRREVHIHGYRRAGRQRQGLGLATGGPLAVARSIRAVHLAGRPGTGHRVVRGKRPRLEPGGRAAGPGDPPPGRVTSLVVRIVGRPVVLRGRAP